MLALKWEKSKGNKFDHCGSATWKHVPWNTGGAVCSSKLLTLDGTRVGGHGWRQPPFRDVNRDIKTKFARDGTGVAMVAEAGVRSTSLLLKGRSRLLIQRL